MPRRVLERPSPNRDRRPQGAPIDMLVLHYTGMQSAEAALLRLCDPDSRVSAHYLVDEDGSIVALVPEEERAWHAGDSAWQRRASLNDVSIGIELVNPGHEFGYRPFPDLQMRALIRLCQAILARHPIPPGRVLGHADIAPLRKQDPGELFDWRRLAESGIGLWPVDLPLAPADPAEVRRMLAAFGYALGDDEPDLRAVITAFQRHFRPELVDGIADAQTATRLRGLLALL